MKWSDMPIKTKLGITFGIGVLILIATSVTGIILMEKVESRLPVRSARHYIRRRFLRSR